MALKKAPPESRLSKASTERAQIFVCYHKPSEILKNRYIRPIHVGREKSNVLLGDMIGDDTGDNISSRNETFCELTALYWAWRNVDAEYYGLMHYRRVFDFTGEYRGTECYSLDEWEQQDLGIVDGTICSVLDGCDVILPKVYDLPLMLGCNSVWEQYSQEHPEEDLQLLRTVVQTKAPQTLEDFDAVFSGTRTYFFNMFVMRKELFHNYAKWLFSILFEVESRIDLSHHDAYQQRIFGFMAERLLTVYIHHCQRVQGIRINELPVVFVFNAPRGLVRKLQAARRRLVRLRIHRNGVHVRLLGWELRCGKGGENYPRP